MAEVIPAIIPKSFEALLRDIEKVAPHAKTVQVDIMDGKFAPEPSFPFIAGDFEQLLSQNAAKEHRVGIELDMMVFEPEKYFESWSEFGVTSFILHFESTDTHERLIEELRKKGKGVGLAFKPATPLLEFEHLIEHVDFVQCMGNDKIGFHGVALSDSAISAITNLHNAHKECIISCDIGVNLETAPTLIRAGVTKLVSGSAIFNSEDIKDAIRKLSLIT
jgi:ribulose-phosphate 3-epimerase